jgi:hypothetical protein
MKPNAPLRTSIAGVVLVNPGAKDHWVGFGMKGEEKGDRIYDRANIPGNSSAFGTIVTGTSSRTGEYKVYFNVEHCQSNVLTRDACSIDKPSPDAPGLMTVRDIGN